MNNQLKSVLFSFVILLSSFALYAGTTDIITQQAIDRAMAFDMSVVLERYKKDYNVDDAAAKEHERELKRYLVLCKDEKLSMFSKEVDNLWHTFIIHTKLYERFCRTVLGRFLHHNPFSEADKKGKNCKADRTMFKEIYEHFFKEEPLENVWLMKGKNCLDGDDTCEPFCGNHCDGDCSVDKCDGD